MSRTLLRAIVCLFALSACVRNTLGEEWKVSGKPLFQEPRAVKEAYIRKPDNLSSFRICSYNIQDFADGVNDGKRRTPKLALRHAQMAASMLDDIKADVVVLQEIEGPKALKQLNQSLVHPYQQVHVTSFGHPRFDDRKLNLAVMSKLPLTGLKEIDFYEMEGSGRPARGLLRFGIELEKGRYLLVYVVHLKSNWGERPRNEEKRRRALEILRADARRVLARYPKSTWEVMMIGDTNVDPELEPFAKDPSFEPLSDWTDLWRGIPISERATCPTRRGDPSQEFPPACFDRIIVNPELSKEPWVVGIPRSVKKGVNTADSRAVGGEGGHISDHYPVYVDITK